MPDFADDLVGRIDDADRIAAVRQAVGKLRQREREVIALCVWAGLDYATAAQALGAPVGTVRSRLSRARRKLAKLLGDAGQELNGSSGQVHGDRGNAVRPFRR